jgi:hypothetical protein
VLLWDVGPRLGENSFDDTPNHLCDAAHRGDHRYIRRSLLDPNGLSTTGRTPLLNAVLCNQRKVMDALAAKHGFDVNAEYLLAGNPTRVLFRAASADISLELFVLLIQRFSADVNLANTGDGLTALDHCVTHGELDKLRYLLSLERLDLGSRASAVTLAGTERNQVVAVQMVLAAVEERPWMFSLRRMWVTVCVVVAKMEFD